jgi:hypothetical protein
MKYPVPIIGLLALSLTGTTQNNISTLSLSALPSVTIHLQPSGPTLPGAFAHFDVIDQRTDTARIGIHTFVPTIGRSHNNQLVFPRPAAAEVAAFLNKNFAAPGAHWSALVILRNLWLSDANYLKEDKVKDDQILDQKTHIRLKAEIYACNDSVYIPILRFDTLQTYKNNNQYNNWSSYYSLWEYDLTAVLSEMADSISALAQARVENGRRLHREDILQFNQSRFDPAITASNVLAAGVYASFQEFRDNTPSVQNFEVQQQKGDRVLYLKDAGGSLQYSHDAWGYCDGKTIFIMRDGKLYPLWKEGKAFYFFSQAYKEYNLPNPPATWPGAPRYDPQYPVTAADVLLSGPPPPGTTQPNLSQPWVTKTARNRQRIYTLDMDSGSVY